VAAGELEGARRYVLAAAGQASSAFAFDRAAKLYSLALEIGSADLPEHELEARRGYALASAGRSREAGQAFERAARAVRKVHGGGQVAQALSFQRSAAEHFLKSGYDAEGLAAIQAMLTHFDISYPDSRNEALVKAMAHRIMLLARGLKAGSVPTSRRHALERVDALWVVAMTMGFVNHARASYFSIRCLLESLETGHPARIVRACAIECTQWGAMPGSFTRRIAERILGLGDGLAEQLGSPYDRGVMLGAKACLAWFAGRWASTIGFADEGARILRSCHGSSFELAVLDTWSFSALAFKGDLHELVARVESAQEDSERRDDRFLARNTCLGQPVLAWLAVDRPDFAVELADRTVAWWPEADHRTEQYFLYVAKAQALLYRGDADAAYALTLKHWPMVENDFFLGMPCVRDELWHLRARTAIAIAAERYRKGRASEGRKYVEEARRGASLIERHGLDCGRAWAALIRAGAESISGDRGAAVAALEDAIEWSDRTEMAMHREAARHCLGIVVGGERGGVAARRATSWFESQHVKNQDRLIATIATGCALGGAS
jgi:hypothetical protein